MSEVQSPSRANNAANGGDRDRDNSKRSIDREDYSWREQERNVGTHGAAHVDRKRKERKAGDRLKERNAIDKAVDGEERRK